MDIPWSENIVEDSIRTSLGKSITTEKITGEQHIENITKFIFFGTYI